MYEYVLERLCNDMKDEECSLVKKSFINLAKQNKIDPTLG